MDYVERQNEWLKNSGVKEGDRVLVVAGHAEWDDGEDETVGMVGTVGEVRSEGVFVRFGAECPCGSPECSAGWEYPFYLLTKVEND